MTVTLEVILGILTIVQVIAGVATWYMGMQIKLLRAEFVHRDACHVCRQDLDKQLAQAFAKIERLTALEDAKRNGDA